MQTLKQQIEAKLIETKEATDDKAIAEFIKSRFGKLSSKEGKASAIAWLEQCQVEDCREQVFIEASEHFDEVECLQAPESCDVLDAQSPWYGATCSILEPLNNNVLESRLYIDWATNRIECLASTYDNNAYYPQGVLIFDMLSEKVWSMPDISATQQFISDRRYWLIWKAKYTEAIASIEPKQKVTPVSKEVTSNPAIIGIAIALLVVEAYRFAVAAMLPVIAIAFSKLQTMLTAQRLADKGFAAAAKFSKFAASLQIPHLGKSFSKFV
jgi:hypothetical protein